MVGTAAVYRDLGKHYGQNRVSYRGGCVGHESACITGICKSGEWSNRCRRGGWTNWWSVARRRSGVAAPSAAAVLASDDRAESRAIVQDLLRLEHQNPQLARARATLQGHTDDIIDGADLIRLAERELMTPLDQEARRLVSSAAQRVSLVTAVSPRALIDVLFVFAASLRLIWQLARLYGGRPGALGMIALMRHVIAHVAITGGMAASDGLIQQMLGHGIAAKLSQRLGEGVLNGLLTARLGLAAIDVTRPLPFTALPRPALADLAKDLLRKRDDEA